MSAKAASLLRDLASVLARHPSPAWAHLAKLIEQQRTRVHLIQFLRTLSEKRSPAESAPRKRKPAHVRPKTKAQTLAAKDKRSEWLELDLSRQSIAALRDLLRDHGLTFSPKDSKRRLIDKLLKSSLAGSRVAFNSRGSSSDSSSDYAQWAEIIMGRNKNRASR